MDFKEKTEQNKILQIRVGSHLFGTNTPDSDLDMYGVFMPFPEIVYGCYSCEEVKFDIYSKDETGRNTADAIDFTLTEYRKYVRLALQNNPNIIHTLFVNQENIIYINEFGQRLLDKAELFPHKGCFDRFIKYADSQKHKMMIKSENYSELQLALEFLKNKPLRNIIFEYKNTTPFKYNEGRHLKVGDLHLDIAIDVAKAIRVIEERIAKATNRTQLYTKYGFDVKYGSNLIQLLMEGIEILKTGRIEFPLTYKDEILKIKQGFYKPDQIMKWADDLTDEARSVYKKSKLPDGPRTKEIESFAMYEVQKWMHEEE
jgi:uncharacterized protein